MSEGLHRRTFIKGAAALVASTLPQPAEAGVSVRTDPFISQVLYRERELLSHQGKDMITNASKEVSGRSRVARFEVIVNAFKPAHIPLTTWQELKKILIGLPAQESRFDPQRKNIGSGATGLCQITATALDDLSQQFKLPRQSLNDMTNADTAAKTMLHIFDTSLYTRLHNQMNLLSSTFGLSEKQAAIFQAFILVNGYNVGPTIMNSILRKFVSEVLHESSKDFLGELTIVLRTHSGSDLFDLIRTRAYEQKYEKYFKNEAYYYVAYVLAAANVLREHKNILSVQNAS